MITYSDVNAGLKDVIDYLNSIENVWNEPRTLKLHDVSYQASDIIEKYPLVKAEYREDDLFSWFCDSEYMCFEEWMKEENIEDCRKYIGHTSSFYLTNIHDDRIDYVIANLFDAVSGCYAGIDVNENGRMIEYTDTEYFTEQEQIEETQPDMEYVACGEFLKDIKEYLSDAVEIADYIDSFKKNQIECFTEFIENRNDLLEYEAEQERAEEQAFIDKYAKVIIDTTAYIEDAIKKTGCTIGDARRIISKSFEAITA